MKTHQQLLQHRENEIRILVRGEEEERRKVKVGRIRISLIT